MHSAQNIFDFLDDNRFLIEKSINNLEQDIEKLSNCTQMEKLFTDISALAKEHEIHEVEFFSDNLKKIFVSLSSNSIQFINLLGDVILLSVDHLFDLTRFLIESTAHFDLKHTDAISLLFGSPL